jgi:predicted nucleic-acid-binding protein
MIGIDTNILLRWLYDGSFSQDSAEQASLVSDLLMNSDEVFYINHIVLVETIWVLLRKMKLGRAVVADVVERLTGLSNVEIESREVVERALASFLRYPGDFTDHLIGEINAAAHCETTFTFDRAAAKSPKFSELQKGY